MTQTQNKIVVTRLDGPVDANPTERRSPTWGDIEAAIRRLDGRDCTLVCLGIGGAPVPHMAVGGGEDGKYIVYATNDNRTFYNLVNPQSAPGKCMLKAGGQFGDYELKLCVSLADALRAAKTYSETGCTDVRLNWEKQT